MVCLKFLPVKSRSETTEGQAVIDEPQSQEQAHMVSTTLSIV